jgi:phosphatidate cytidylyltransferase
MKQRVITALWGIPLLFLGIWLGHPWFTVLVALVAFLAAREFYRLAARSGAQPLSFFGMLWAILVVLLSPVRFSIPLVLLAGITLSLAGVILFRRREKPLACWLWTWGGILYTGWMLSYYVALRDLLDGIEWVLLAVLATFACDTFAFLGGRAWGRHRMAPSISPGKTWEGAVIGFLAAIATVLIFDQISTLPLDYMSALILGSLIGIFAQVGDLAESRLKREAGVKDSGDLLPGHGGILDRADSLIFSGIVVYYYVMLVVAPSFY